MTVPLFIAPRVSLVGDDLLLDGSEGRHAVAVRRVRVGERVDVTDGAGLRVECVVTEVVGSDGARLAVVDRIEESVPSPRFVVVQAIPKGDRGELAVEVLTEVGADVIVPWSASRCVAQWKGERGDKAADRWRSSAREASKQAHRAWVPEVCPQVTTREVVGLIRDAERAVVLHEEATEPLAAVTLPTSGDIVVIVGPEGGISPEEVTAFTSAGATIGRLGPTVLRTSTAGVAALGVLMSRTARWA